jgi:hypothetical protein
VREVAVFCLDETGRRLYRSLFGQPTVDTLQAGEPAPDWATPLLRRTPSLKPEGVDLNKLLNPEFAERVAAQGQRALPEGALGLVHLGGVEQGVRQADAVVAAAADAGVVGLAGLVAVASQRPTQRSESPP